jgi:peptidoglycan-associated lipoprotein
MNRTTSRLLGLLALSSSLAACGGAKTNDHDSPFRVRASTGDTHVEVVEVDPCHVGTLFFAHNSADLDMQSTSELERIATCVSRERGMPVHLVGSADPRGTEEYNLALGERRAQTVRDYLVNLGVDDRLLTFATVGEEFARGTSEATWALDRHVEPMVHETSRGLRRPDEGYSHALDRPRIDARGAHE